MQLRENRTWIVALCVVMAMTFSTARSWSLDLPEQIVSKLGAEEFSVRETAQKDLLAWAREHGDPAMEELFRQSRKAGDPEVRQRCLDVLHEMVMDEYMKGGQGYLGISMQDELAKVPGDEKPRNAIRLAIVIQDSAAQKGGLQANDLIIGLNGEALRDSPASGPFTTKIRAMKPGTVVTLQYLRNGAVHECKVKLNRRPAAADNPIAAQDADTLEKIAKDDFFHQWMEKRKPRK